MAFTLPRYTASGALPSSNFDSALVVIVYGFFGGVFGLFVSLVTLAFARQGYFSRLRFRQILGLVIFFGLAHSLVFAALEYQNAIEGMQPAILDEFAKQIIWRTACIEFLSGSLISLISILAVKYALKSG